jgi:hypothetical protein
MRWRGIIIMAFQQGYAIDQDYIVNVFLDHIAGIIKVCARTAYCHLFTIPTAFLAIAIACRCSFLFYSIHLQGLVPEQDINILRRSLAERML